MRPTWPSTPSMTWAAPWPSCWTSPHPCPTRSARLESSQSFRMYDAPAAPLTEAELRSLDAQYCSWGDTVHYLDQPKIFESCDGSYMFDAEGRAYLDLQMWYSTANFGYRNPRLAAVA